MKKQQDQIKNNTEVASVLNELSSCNECGVVHIKDKLIKVAYASDNHDDEHSFFNSKYVHVCSICYQDLPSLTNPSSKWKGSRWVNSFYRDIEDKNGI